jgi:APA family basic amino acid/polyamine antiporter
MTEAFAESGEQLPRKLGLFDAAAIVIGIVIGSGIFLLPNLIARSVASGAAIIAIWVCGGVLSWFGALAYAELGALNPATGGQYVYLRDAFGGLCAFLCGWVFVLAVIPGGIAFLAVGFSIYLGQFVAMSPGTAKAVSAALVLLLSAVNYVGVRESAWVQRVFTALKIGGLAILIVACFTAPHAAQPASARPLTYSGIGFATTLVLMAYNGWSYVSFVAGEVKDPQRNIPRALALGMGAVMILYIGANLGYMNALSLAQIASADRVGATAAARALGPVGANLISITVLISVTAAINGCILTGSRIPFAQARDGLFFRRFATVHPRFQTPSFAIAVQAVWSVIVLLTGSYENLSSYSILPAWVFYSLCVLAVLVLRRKMPDAPRPYRMWGYPATMWLFLAVSVWFIADALVTQTGTSLIALGIALAGVPLYFIWR